MARPLRADARRNYDAIVQAAVEEVGSRGATASLEDIAKRAGVGSATLHRHFPTRNLLLQAVFADGIAALASRASDLAQKRDAGSALRTWLSELAAYSASTRGLADTLDLSAGVDADPDMHTCEILLLGAATTLRDAAASAGAVRRDVGAYDLLSLVNAISLEARNHTDPEAFATRLLDLAFDGISRSTPSPATDSRT